MNNFCNFKIHSDVVTCHWSLAQGRDSRVTCTRSVGSWILASRVLIFVSLTLVPKAVRPQSTMFRRTKKSIKLACLPNFTDTLIATNCMLRCWLRCRQFFMWAANMIEHHYNMLQTPLQCGIRQLQIWKACNLAKAAVPSHELARPRWKRAH